MKTLKQNRVKTTEKDKNISLHKIGVVNFLFSSGRTNVFYMEKPTLFYLTIYLIWTLDGLPTILIYL